MTPTRTSISRAHGLIARRRCTYQYGLRKSSDGSVGARLPHRSAATNQWELIDEIDIDDSAIGVGFRDGCDSGCCRVFVLQASLLLQGQRTRLRASDLRLLVGVAVQ